jgi:hypothetical protein
MEQQISINLKIKKNEKKFKCEQSCK